MLYNSSKKKMYHVTYISLMFLGPIWLFFNVIITIIFSYTILHKKIMSLNSSIQKNDARLKNVACNDEFQHFRKMKKLPHKKKYCEVSHI